MLFFPHPSAHLLASNFALSALTKAICSGVASASPSGVAVGTTASARDCCGRLARTDATNAARFCGWSIRQRVVGVTGAGADAGRVCGLRRCRGAVVRFWGACGGHDAGAFRAFGLDIGDKRLDFGLFGLDAEAEGLDAGAEGLDFLTTVLPFGRRAVVRWRRFFVAPNSSSTVTLRSLSFGVLLMRKGMMNLFRLRY